MCRHIGLDTSKYSPLMRESLNIKLNNRILWENVSRGRTICITGICQIDQESMEIIFQTKYAGKSDDCLSSAILQAEKYTVDGKSEHAAKMHDSLHKFREEILNEEVQVLLVTPKQLIRCLGFAFDRNALEAQVRQSRSVSVLHSKKEMQTATLVSMTQLKVISKITSLLDSYLERMQRRNYLVAHKGMLFKYNFPGREVWNIPPIDEVVFLQSAKLEVLEKMGCATEQEVILSGKYVKFKADVLAKVSEIYITDFCQMYQIAFQSSILRKFLSVDECHKEKLLDLFLSGFYKSDMKYLDKLKSRLNLYDGLEDFQSVDQLLEENMILHEPAETLITESFALDMRQFYEAYLTGRASIGVNHVN
jgi:hypothetical protein